MNLVVVLNSHITQVQEQLHFKKTSFTVEQGISGGEAPYLHSNTLEKSAPPKRIKWEWKIKNFSYF